MNKNVLTQIGCFLAMFILELIAVNFDPSSVMFNVLLVLAFLMIPVFIFAGRSPKASNSPTDEEASLLKAA